MKTRWLVMTLMALSVIVLGSISDSPQTSHSLAESGKKKDDEEKEEIVLAHAVMTDFNLTDEQAQAGSRKKRNERRRIL